MKEKNYQPTIQKCIGKNCNYLGLIRPDYSTNDNMARLLDTKDNRFPKTVLRTCVGSIVDLNLMIVSSLL